MSENVAQLSLNLTDEGKITNTGNPIRRFSDVMKTDYAGVNLGEVRDIDLQTDKRLSDVGNVIFAPVDFAGALVGVARGQGSEAGVQSARQLRNYVWDTTVKSTSTMINEIYWGAAGLLYGAVPQALGNLAGDTDMVEQGVFVRDYANRRMNDYADRQALLYNEKPENIGEEIVGGVAQAAVQIAPTLLGGANAGTTVSRLFGVESMFSYLKDNTSTKEEMLDQEAGGVISDVAWAGFIGTVNYYINKFTGAVPVAEKLFAKSAQDLLVKSGEKVIRSAFGEGIGEVAQNMLPSIADRFRGRKTNADLVNDLMSREQLVTFISSAILGGTLGGAEYYSARGEMQSQIKDNLRNKFGITEENKLESLSDKMMKGTEEMLSDVRKQIMVDDQLKNKYGITYNRINERVDSLINQSIANAEIPEIENFDGIKQAQLVGSISQRFTDELYGQAVLRGAPVSEVFDETKIDVENGIMYMYGESYGKRNLAKFGNANPEEFTRNAIASKEIDSLQKQMATANQDTKLELKSQIDALKAQMTTGVAKNVVFPVKATGKGTIGGFNPIRGSLWLKQGWNETTISKEFSAFWLDNMKRFAASTVGKDTEFAKIWNSIKTYLDIDDRQRVISNAQAQKYASAYMEFLRTNKTPYNVDMGFKSMNEWFGNISDEFFENYLSEFNEIEKSTPDMVDVLQKLTSADLSKYKDASIERIEKQAASKAQEKIEKPAEKISAKEDAKERGLPAEAANPEHQTPKPIESYSKGEGEEFIRGGAKSAIKEAIAKGVELDLSEFGNEQIERVRDSKAAAERAAEFVVDNPELAMDILNFEAPLPENMLINEVVMAMRHKVIATGDAYLINDVINSRASKSVPDVARNLQALGVNRFDRQFDPVRAIMAIEGATMKSKGANEKFQNLLRDMEKEIKMEMSQADFDGLIDMLRC